MRGDLRGIPFRLCRSKVKVSTPGTAGQRVRREKWLLSIEPTTDWVQLQIEAMRISALPGMPALKALPAPTRVVDYATGEVTDTGEPIPDDDDDAEFEDADVAQDHIGCRGRVACARPSRGRVQDVRGVRVG